MPRFPSRLKPNDTECANQSQGSAQLELPLPDDMTFLRKKCEREQRSEAGFLARVIERGDRLDWAGAAPMLNSVLRL